MSHPDVLIVGAGIGGLTLAIALRQHGVRTEIVEAADELRPVGAGIWMPPNAMQVLAKLGVAGDLRARGLEVDGVDICEQDGTVLQSIESRWLRERFGRTILALLRSRLQEGLLTHLGETPLHIGKRCTGFQDHGDCVTARFADGTEKSAQLLVGADGLRSAIRQQLFPEGRLRYSGQTCFRGVARLRLDEPQGRARETWGGAARFGFSAVSEDEVYWFAPLTAPAEQRIAQDDIPALLSSKYEEFVDPIPRILAAEQTGELLQTDLYDLRPMRSWTRGRVVLIGDAAHAATPNLGQGGAQAIEDAAALAEHIAAAGPTPEACLAFQHARMSRTRRIVALSRAFGRLAHVEQPLLRPLRNALFRWTPQRINDAQLARVFSAGP